MARGLEQAGGVLVGARDPNGPGLDPGGVELRRDLVVGRLQCLGALVTDGVHHGPAAVWRARSGRSHHRTRAAVNPGAASAIISSMAASVRSWRSEEHRVVHERHPKRLAGRPTSDPCFGYLFATQRFQRGEKMAKVSLEGKVVAITGGARGIGRCTAAGAHQAGREGGHRRPRRRSLPAHGIRAWLGHPGVRPERDRPQVLRRVLRGRDGRDGPDRRADQQRGDHAARRPRRRVRRDGYPPDRHQPARRDLRHQDRPEGHALPELRPYREHRLDGRQGRVPARGHLLRDQARSRRAVRGGARRDRSTRTST